MLQILTLAVADEEAGSQNGVAYLLNNFADDFQAGLVINEAGLYGLDRFDGWGVKIR